MTQKEIDNFFKFEKEKHTGFFLPFYKEKNWLVHQDNIDGNVAIDWDVKLEISAGKIVLVDEKARVGEYDDFLVEIIQDLKTGKLGWLFGKKDYILYASWRDIETYYPSSLYMVNSDKLKIYIESLDGFKKVCISKKGWGITWNITLDWEMLITKNIAKKLLN